MKKDLVTPAKSLSLNKETLHSLDQVTLSQIAGGILTNGPSCRSACPTD